MSRQGNPQPSAPVASVINTAQANGEFKAEPAAVAVAAPTVAPTATGQVTVSVTYAPVMQAQPMWYRQAGSYLAGTRIAQGARGYSTGFANYTWNSQPIRYVRTSRFGAAIDGLSQRSKRFFGDLPETFWPKFRERILTLLILAMAHRLTIVSDIVPFQSRESNFWKLCLYCTYTYAATQMGRDLLQSNKGEQLADAEFKAELTADRISTEQAQQQERGHPNAATRRGIVRAQDLAAAETTLSAQFLTLSNTAMFIALAAAIPLAAMAKTTLDWDTFLGHNPDYSIPLALFGLSGMHTALTAALERSVAFDKCSQVSGIDARKNTVVPPRPTNNKLCFGAAS